MKKVLIVKRKEKITALLIFLMIFVTGLIIVGDYGATLDDVIYFNNGLESYNYVKAVIFNIFTSSNEHNITNNLKEWPTTFELIHAFAVDLLKISTTSEIYKLGNLLNFIFFFISIILIFKLIKRRFGNILLGYLASFSLIFSPRIFSESFYNSRDIFFMSLFIFFIYFVYKYLNNNNAKNIIYVSIFSALLINTKVLGIIPVVIFLGLLSFDSIGKRKENFIEIGIIASATIFFIYLFWPYLWDDLLTNLVFAFKNILEVHESFNVITQYFNEYISSKNVEWHYRITWFLITTPVIIILVFTAGLILITKNLVIKILNIDKTNTFNLTKNEFLDIFLFFVLILSTFTTIKFNDSKFNSWRHLYYLYPIVIYCGIYFINNLKKFNRVNVYKLVIILFFLNFTYTFNWMIVNHPYQYVFFNFISKNYSIKSFDLDYWGVSHKDVLKKILKEDNRSTIKIAAKGFTSLEPNILLLKKENQLRVRLVDIEKADYIIDNNMKRIRANYKINREKYSMFFQIMVNNFPINTVYKRK